MFYIVHIFCALHKKYAQCKTCKTIPKKKGTSKAVHELEREKKRLGLETQGKMLELVKLRLDLMQRRLDLHEQSLDYSFRVANQIIETLSPNMDQETKKILTQDLIPHILQSQTLSKTEFTDTKEEFEPFDSGEI